MTRMMNLKYASLTLAAGALSLAASSASADQVILDDLIVDGSICAGFDCVNGESFGFDTLRLKENNLRIRFLDTSNSASFPTNDWQLTANDTSNGGANKFSIDDIDGGRTPFTLEAGAPSHSLYVDDGGRLGFGTNTPVADLHVKTGNTPTLRLEQDGSSGFTPQTWDLAGNEANFFIRDATSGSTLPFRLYPGAPSNALTIEGTTGDIGLGTTSPDSNLHIWDSNPGQAMLHIEDTSATFVFMRMSTAAGTGSANEIDVTYTDAGGADELRYNINDDAAVEMALNAAGDLSVTGSFISNGATLTVPDYVFADDYELMPLAEVEKFIVANRHLPKIPSATEINGGTLNMTEMQMALLEKVEELTLYTLEQQKTIDVLQEQLEELAD